MKTSESLNRVRIDCSQALQSCGAVFFSMTSAGQGKLEETLTWVPGFTGMNLHKYPDALPVSCQVTLSGFPRR